MVDVTIQLSGNINVTTDNPPTKTVSLSTTPVDVDFSLFPFGQNSKLGCFEVTIGAFDGAHEDDLNFESRVRPTDGFFDKVFDFTNGLGFVGLQDTSCNTPSLMNQAPEQVEATAFAGSPLMNVNYERNGQGVRQNPGVLEYAFSPKCMVAFKRVPNPLLGGTSLINWNTIGFPRVVDWGEITNREITNTRQSNFGPNLVDQIWMAPDGTAHVQVTDIIGTGSDVYRQVAGFDNITGERAVGGSTVCPVVKSMERADNQIVIESEEIPIPPATTGNTCTTKILTFGLPSCD